MIELTVIKLIKRKLPLTTNEIKGVVKEVLKSEKISKDVSLSLVVVSNKLIQSNNKIYRKKDKPTDILSFPNNSENLGDLLVSPDYIKKDYKQYEHSLKAHYIRLLVHGVLHLLGYDHIKVKDFEKMSKKEKNLLLLLSKKYKLKINF